MAFGRGSFSSNLIDMCASGRRLAPLERAAPESDRGGRLGFRLGIFVAWQYTATGFLPFSSYSVAACALLSIPQ
jgi:hypothetical protein